MAIKYYFTHIQIYVYLFSFTVPIIQCWEDVCMSLINFMGFLANMLLPTCQTPEMELKLNLKSTSGSYISNMSWTSDLFGG